MSARGRVPSLVSVGTGLVAFGVYAATGARSITWWEGASYPLAAVTLGIPGSPGSVLLTILGWLWLKLPLAGETAFRLSLLAAVIAAIAVALVTRLSIRLSSPGERDPGIVELVTGAAAGLTFGFALTTWTYAVQFTPYVLTAVFTAGIALTALGWARDPRPWRLFLLFLMLGLDFSVHRTNLIVAPALLLWLALHRKGLRPLPIALGLTLGFGFHLLLIPIALRRPWYDFGHTTDLASLWDYVEVGRSGGHFLFNVWPRRGPVVELQLADYASFLRANLAWPTLALAGIGWIAAFRVAPRRTLGLFAFFLCASLGTVAYFNLPPGYFRSLDRHYLASLALLAPMIGVGAAALVRASRATRGAVLAGAPLLALLPASELAANRITCDLSHARFAETYARNVLETLPRDAILFTNGDNDTVPLWYAQRALGVRPDVSVLNLPTLNVAKDVAHYGRLDPRLNGLVVPEVGYAYGFDTTVALGADSVTFRRRGVAPAEDEVVLQLIQRAGRTRPICVASTVTPAHLNWIFPHLVLEGLSYRLVPGDSPVPDVTALARRLRERVNYHGLSDPGVPLDQTTRIMSASYLAALLQLAESQLAAGNAAACLDTIEFAQANVPYDRLGIKEDPLDELRRKALAAAKGSRHGGETGIDTPMAAP